MSSLSGSIRTVGFVLAFVAGAAFAEPVYTASTYTVGKGAETDFVPESRNLLRLAGVSGAFVSNSQLGSESTSKDIGMLSNGEIVDGEALKENCCTLGDNSILSWTLPGGVSYQLEEIRIYSLWGDNNRNDISVRSVEVMGMTGEWTTIDGSTFCSSQEKNNYDPNTIGEPLLTSHRRVTFAAATGCLAQNVTAIRITFGKQDNGYGGFAEIEAVGGETVNTYGSATVRGEVTYASVAGVDTFTFASSGSTISFNELTECVRTEGDMSYAFTLQEDEEYAITLSGTNAVVIAATPAGAASAPTPRILGCTGTIVDNVASATLTLGVSWAGSEMGSASSLELRWWRRGTTDAVTTVPVEGSFACGGTTSVVLNGLTPGFKYCAQLTASAGGKTGASDVYTFKVRDPAPQTILSSVGYSGAEGNLENTTIGLTVNVPGGTWLCGGGWEWAQPTYSTYEKRLFTGEEKACAALPITSVGDYDKPTRLTISGTIRHSQGAGGIGFWSSVQPRSKEYTEETYDPVGGTTIVTKTVRRYNGRQGYTGLIFFPAEKKLQVYSGEALGSSITVETTGDKDYHTLLYTVNTSNGELEYVVFNGKLVLGLSCDSFTADKTRYAGFMSYDAGRTECRDFMLTEGQEMPVDPVVTISDKRVVVRTGDAVAIPVSAVNPITLEPVPVTLASFDGEGAAITDGVFTWTAGAAGKYVFGISATIGSSTVTEQGEIRVYGPAPAAPAEAKPIFLTDLVAPSSDVKFAGTLQTNATDLTDFGLVVNRPGSLWMWDSGFDWAPPKVVKNTTVYNLTEEGSTVHLSITNTATFTRPRRLYVRADFTYSGRGCVGFWSQRQNKRGSLGPTKNFTGLVFDRSNNTIQPYSNGSAVGSAATIELPAGVSQQTIRFAVDTKTHRFTDVVYNGFTVGDFELPDLTEEKTPLFGIGSCGNFTGYSSRLQFQRLELDGIFPSGMAIFIR